MRAPITILLTAALILAAASFAVIAQPMYINWYTIDSGGIMSCSSADFAIAGTMGQPDVGDTLIMTGPTLSLTGGFWAMPACTCVSDMNGDGLRNGEDIQAFVYCVIYNGPGCECADVEGDGDINADDVGEFVSDLLDGQSCPY